MNVTLPDDKANYIHRIGRVGRAERFVCIYAVGLGLWLGLEYFRLFQSFHVLIINILELFES